MSMSPETPTTNNYVTRFFGGPPLSVIFRLVLLSILIGVILEVLGLDPRNVIDSLRRLILRIWDMGFGGADLADHATHGHRQRAMTHENRSAVEQFQTARRRCNWWKAFNHLKYFRSKCPRS
jgi:hypothetical protein